MFLENNKIIGMKYHMIIKLYKLDHFNKNNDTKKKKPVKNWRSKFKRNK